MAIDFSKYSIEDLKSSLRGIDSNAYPDRVREIEEEIQIRLGNPRILIDETIAPGFFSLHFPADIAFQITVRIILWCILFGILVTIPLGGSIALLFLFTGISEANGNNFLQVSQFATGPIITFLAVRKALASRYNRFEIAIFRRDS